MAESAAESMSPDPTEALSFLFLVKGLEFVSYSCVSVFLPRVHGACGSQEGALDPLEQELG